MGALVLDPGAALADGGQLGGIARPARRVRTPPARLGPGVQQLVDRRETGPDHQADRGRVVVGQQRGLHLVGGQQIGVRFHDPPWMGTAQGQRLDVIEPVREVVGPLVPGACRDLAQHRVHQSGHPLTDGGRGEVDRGGHGGMGGHPHAQQLMASEPEQVQHGGLEGAEGPTGGRHQDLVVGSLQPAGAGQQLGGEGGVPAGDPPRGQQRWQHQVRVRVVGVHAAQAVEGGPACGIGGSSPGRRPRGRHLSCPGLRPR